VGLLVGEGVPAVGDATGALVGLGASGFEGAVVGASVAFVGAPVGSSGFVGAVVGASVAFVGAPVGSSGFVGAVVGASVAFVGAAVGASGLVGDTVGVDVSVLLHSGVLYVQMHSFPTALPVQLGIVSGLGLQLAPIVLVSPKISPLMS